MKEFHISDDHILISYHGPGGHIRVPDGVKAIGGYGFANGDYHNIFQVVLPEGLETIGFGAFSGCAGMTRVHFPSSLKAVEYEAFSGCIRLERIDLPQGLEEIGRHAFYSCEQLENVAFPESLKAIGDSAFQGCSSMTEITLPGGLEKLGDAAFARCISLKRVSVPGGVKALPTWAFQNCYDLEEISLPEGLEVIEGGAFNGCGNLKELHIPETVHTIGSRAFRDCISLPGTMILPVGLKKLGAEALGGCPIQSISMGEEAFAAFSYRNFPGGNAGLAVQTDSGWRFYGYAAKTYSDSLSEYIRRGKWNTYDLQLINNGPEFKFKGPARLLGCLGRLVDPVDLTDECRALHLEFLIKNAKKLIPIAEQLRCPAIVEAMKEHGVINDKNKKAIAKLLAASNVPEIAAISL